MAMTSSASPGLIAALGTRLLQGRDFTEQESEVKQRVAIVNDTFARRFWPGQSVIGKRFSFESAAGPWVEIVGVIQDGKYFSLAEETTPFLYTNLRPQNGGWLTLIVRTTSEPQS